MRIAAALLLLLLGCGNACAETALLPGDERYIRADANYGSRFYERTLVLNDAESLESRLVDPEGLALDADGSLLVFDRGADRVHRFARDAPRYRGAFGVSGRQAGEIRGPVAGTLLPGGGFAIVEARNHRVSILGKDRTFKRSFGSLGEGSDRFSEPRGIAVSKGSIFIVDTYNNRVKRHELVDTRFAHEFGAPPRAAIGPTPSTRRDALVPYLSRPSGIAIDETGEIFVTDTGNDRVVCFDQGGKLTRYTGELGVAAPDLRGPRGIALDRGGNLYVADTLNGRVRKLSPDLSPMATIDVVAPDGRRGQPIDVAVDERGAIATLDRVSGTIHIFEAEWFAKAREQIARGRFEPAVPLLERAVAADPKNPYAQYYLALSLEKTGRLSEARDVLKPMLARFARGPVNNQSRFLLKKIEDRLGFETVER